MYNGLVYNDSIIRTRYSLIGMLYTNGISKNLLFSAISARNDFPYDIIISRAYENNHCISYYVYAISGKSMASATKQFIVFLKQLCKHEHYEGRVSFNSTLKNKHEDYIATKTEKKFGSIVGEMVDVKRQLDQLNEKFDKIQSTIDKLC